MEEQMTTQLTFNDQKLNKLSELLQESISIYRTDRDRAVEHFNDMKSQLSAILSGPFEMSEEAALERECNKALKLVFESSKRLDEVIKRVTELIITQLNNESKEKIVQNMGNMIPDGAVNFNALRNRRSGQKELNYDEEDCED